MVITNALLSIGISFASNFVHTAGLPKDIAPKGTQDIKQAVCGLGLYPLETYLVLSNGHEFWINHGAVYKYGSPMSYRRHPSRAIQRSSSGPVLSSNQAVELATKVVGRLARARDPVADVAPVVAVTARTPDGEPAFYSVTWRGVAFPRRAAVEIDAQAQKPTLIELFDSVYFDYALDRDISNRVVIPNPVYRAPPASQRIRPTAKQVDAGIASWLKLCSRLDFNPGQKTNLASVDWDYTYLCEDRSFPTANAANPVVIVRLFEGQQFSFHERLVIFVETQDACFQAGWGSKDDTYFSRFRGPIAVRWEDLARDLEAKLVDRVGLKKEVLLPLEPAPVYGGFDEVGTVGLKRILVKWRLKSDARAQECILAEFDLETGDLKRLFFRDSGIREALRQAMNKKP